MGNPTVTRDPRTGAPIGFGARVGDAADNITVDRLDEEDRAFLANYDKYLAAQKAKGVEVITPDQIEQTYQLYLKSQNPDAESVPQRGFNLRPEHSEPLRSTRPYTPDPRIEAMAQQQELKRLAALFHAGQMNQINYGKLTPASQQLFQDYMQLWQGVPGAPRTMNPNNPAGNQPPAPILQRRPGRYGTRPI